MAITDYKVSEAYAGRDISSLPDRPNEIGMGSATLKARFDQLGKEVIPNYNDLIDFINLNLFSGGTQIGHTHNVDILEDGTTNRLYTDIEKTKLAGIAEGAEVNQNTFSNVKVGSTTIPSTTKTDTLELVAGLNITMTVDALTKKISLSATGELATEAVQSLIIDIGNYYEALNVEDALQELGAVINGLLRSEAYFDFDSNQQIVTLNFQDGTSLNLGSELWYAQGKAVGSIANGDNVMLAGSQGDHYLVKKAVASELATNPQLYLGVATKGSANNEWVKVTRWGLVHDVNTNGWAYGTKLYFNPVTLGFTDVLPSLPNARIEVGMVVRQHATDGVILVLPFALNLYTNAELDALLSGKSDVGHTHDDRYFTESEVTALVNAKATYTVYTATIPSASWTGASAPFSKAVAVTGLLSTDEPIIDLVLSGTYATDVTMRENWSKIYRGVTSADSITFYADSVPSADISIQLVVVR
jgi:hypothetical protein